MSGPSSTGTTSALQLLSGERVLVCDDLLATGGTANATIELVREQGGRVVGSAFVVELTLLKGRERLGNVPVESLIRY